MHPCKKGTRILGIAESFSSRERSVLAGVVMRRDLRIDGIAFTTISVGGMDATERIIGLFHSLARKDINIIMIAGCAMAWYNIINPGQIAQETGVPVINITYEASEGLEEPILSHFPGDTERLQAYQRLGLRTEVKTEDGNAIFIRSFGIDEADAARLCRSTVFDGRIPEPVRVARLMARGFMRYMYALK
jgi:endonuclease V-like protein UPF0215 family